MKHASGVGGRSWSSGRVGADLQCKPADGVQSPDRAQTVWAGRSGGWGEVKPRRPGGSELRGELGGRGGGSCLKKPVGQTNVICCWIW